jgi:hypothetical protein
MEADVAVTSRAKVAAPMFVTDKSVIPGTLCPWFLRHSSNIGHSTICRLGIVTYLLYFEILSSCYFIRHEYKHEQFKGRKGKM